MVILGNFKLQHENLFILTSKTESFLSESITTIHLLRVNWAAKHLFVLHLAGPMRIPDFVRGSNFYKIQSSSKLDLKMLSIGSCKDGRVRFHNSNRSCWVKFQKGQALHCQPEQKRFTLDFLFHFSFDFSFAQQFATFENSSRH